MSTINGLFSMAEIEHSGNTIKARVLINGKHIIFKGHFPDYPVVPGVCLIEMIKESFCRSVAPGARLAEAEWVKFIKAVEPGKNSELEIKIEYFCQETGWKISASIQQGAEQFMKFKGLISRSL